MTQLGPFDFLAAWRSLSRLRGASAPIFCVCACWRFVSCLTGAQRELGLFLPVARLVGLRCSRSLRYCFRIGWFFIPYKKPKAILTPPGFPVENRFPGCPATWTLWSEDGCRQMGLRAYLLPRWRGFLHLRRKQRYGAWRGFDIAVAPSVL